MDAQPLQLFQEWSDARHELDDAIQSHLECTTELVSDVYGPIQGSSTRNSLKQIILEGYNDSESMALRLVTLEEARRILVAIRNSPSPLVPINRLPSGLFQQVFSLIVDPTRRASYSLDYPSQPHSNYLQRLRALLTLSHVCAHWRNMIINAPSLWSHIRVKFDSGGKLTKSCDYLETFLKRAHGAPLYLSIDGKKSIPNLGLEKLNNLLRPSLGTLEVFCLEDFRDSHRLIDLVSFWLTNGRPGAVHTLALTIYKTSNIKLDPRILVPDQQRLDSFLEPIRVLHLRDVYIDRSSSVYCNLVELQLTFAGCITRDSPSVSDVLHILSMSPQLHTLRLGYLRLLALKSDTLQPITLAALKRLEINNVNPRFLNALLPMISLGSRETGEQLIMDFHFDARYFTTSVFQSFLAQSNVVRLYISGPYVNRDGLGMCLSSIPSLHTLILGCMAITGLELSSALLLRPSLSSLEPTPLCPKLHTLCLSHGNFEAASIKAILQVHPSIKRLRFLACILDPSEEDVLSELKPLVEDVACEPYQDPGYLEDSFSEDVQL